MADIPPGADHNHAILNLTPEEKRAFQYLFQQADTEKLGVITGEVAVKFFERTKLAPAVLGEIWQIADTENRGLLTYPGFCQVLRLIGHYQAGRDPSPELAFRPGPLPKFEGLTVPSAPVPPTGFAPPPPGVLQPQMSGGPIRVPPLSPAKAAEYAGLFEKSGAQNGILSGERAKQIFEKARLPNETLGRIWNLADTEQRGALGVTEFIIAMHLLASCKTGALKQLPNNLPAGLYEAASRRPPLPPPPGRRPEDIVPPIPRQFSGAPQNPSPLGRPAYATPPQSAQVTGGDWLISPQEKASYDNLFNKVDTMGRGYITGEQAVQFFSDSGLPEDVLAGIWDLADINSEGQLNRDEFAVAMYLIRQQRKPGTPLPAVLPPNLVPPSMRSQIRAPMAMPAPEPQVFAAAQPKSAADDLFGLDTFSAPPPPAPAQVQQSTGGSNTFNKPFDNDPFASKTGSPTSPQPFQPAPRNPASTFKPFLPTSSFGQTLTSHSTGQSGTSTSQTKLTQPGGIEDLLGESEPDVSKKLSQESTELANMSNQMSTLRTQMQEVQNKKVTTEHEVNSISTQKRDLELRLSQFKSQYELETKAVKALEDRLATSRNETRKLQQELSVLEAQLQDLQNQHRQVGAAFEADQRENANLKERIRQVNAEVAQLKPQLDKLRSDARQQKGLVAINKKQLATNEGERDKIKNEMNDLSKAADESYRGAQGPAASVVSPATSTASHNTNPFFRKSPQPTADNTMSPSGFSQGPHKDFDAVFGNAFTSPQSTAPPTTFRSDSQSQVPTFSAPSGHSVRSSDGPDVPTPSTSPPLSSYQESPRPGEPPAPPESRQFASSFLPLRDTVPRSDSFSSSVKVSAPASRYGGPGNDTPTASKASPAATPIPEKPTAERRDTSKTDADAFGPSLFDRTASPVASVTSDTQRSGSKAEDRRDVYSNFGGPTADLPGAFPRDTTSPLQQMPTGESSLSNQSKVNNRSTDASQNRTDPFSTVGRDQPRGSSSGKVDFDAAFAGFGSARQFPDINANTSTDSGSASKFNKEFPPIEDLGHDDESDSNSEQGFADNFTSASPKQQRANNPESQAPSSGTGATGAEGAPPTTRTDSNASGLPTAGAQKSPPTYDQTVGTSRGSNQFPPEFGGLLPSRTDPTTQPAPSAAPQSTERTFSGTSGGQGAALFGGSAKPTTTSPPPVDTPSSTVPSDAYHSAVSYGTSDTKGPSSGSNVPQPGRSAFNDDFDAGFDDLTEAKEADDKADDDFILSSQHREGFDEFNPVFDSPAASKSNTMASQQTPTGKPHGDDGFGDFEHLSQGFGQPRAHQQDREGSLTVASPPQDWDAIFSNLESQNQKTAQSSGDVGKSVFDTLDKEEAAAASASQPAQKPQLGRALSSGTEHDDPILKKLTGMGYPRAEALNALEKFDYDINKAADYLTSGK
ncbi:uncharacterized protein EI97DRAFT_455235 [Westerdykella ornata]|uniref:EF-hand n=1 Tax=Westerdykella ornata TaxID=318751 RepID=A0A6A6JX78_WESOR|nr:uncharacterized protein EI97DRAFT_455235 [Westerdykella ornata]KAF2280336.1 hypothetical protein EI97DRAFT_455235 [Westerdykella ornata]